MIGPHELTAVVSDTLYTVDTVLAEIDYDHNITLSLTEGTESQPGIPGINPALFLLLITGIIGYMIWNTKKAQYIFE